MTKAGTLSVRALKRAQILLKADEGPDGPGWRDEAIAQALEVHPMTVWGVRKVKFTPVAADQVPEGLHELGVTSVELTENLPRWIGSTETVSHCDVALPMEPKSELEEAAPSEDEKTLLATYDRLLDEIRPHVRAVPAESPQAEQGPSGEMGTFRSAGGAGAAGHRTIQSGAARALAAESDKIKETEARIACGVLVRHLASCASGAGLHELGEGVLPELVEQGYLLNRAMRTAPASAWPRGPGHRTRDPARQVTHDLCLLNLVSFSVCPV